MADPVYHVNPAADPTAIDDETYGFAVGTRWINSLTNASFLCVDATDGAAVWVRQSSPATDLVANGAGGVTGIPDPTASTLTFTDGTRTFQIAPASTSYDVYVNGQKFEKTAAETVIWTDTEGVHHFYFDSDGRLSVTMDAATLAAIFLGAGAYVANVYWDATNSESIIQGEERHGLMPGVVHHALHFGEGTSLVSGGALGDLTVDGDGTNNAHATLSVEDTTILDEDITHAIADDDPQVLAPIAAVPMYYLSGATPVFRKKTATNYPVIEDGTAGYTAVSGYPAINVDDSGWGFLEVTEGNFFWSHLLLSNNITEPLIGIVGRGEYTTKLLALYGMSGELRSLVTDGGLRNLLQEYVLIGSVLVHAIATATNTPQCAIVTTVSGDNYMDHRKVRGVPLSAFQ